MLESGSPQASRRRVRARLGSEGSRTRETFDSSLPGIGHSVHLPGIGQFAHPSNLPVITRDFYFVIISPMLFMSFILKLFVQ